MSRNVVEREAFRSERSPHHADRRAARPASRPRIPSSTRSTKSSRRRRVLRPPPPRGSSAAWIADRSTAFPSGSRSLRRRGNLTTAGAHPDSGPARRLGFRRGRRLREGGASCSEDRAPRVGAGLSNNNEHFGPTRNPWTKAAFPAILGGSPRRSPRDDPPRAGHGYRWVHPRARGSLWIVA